MTLIQDIRAGISGPLVSLPAATQDEADSVLNERGYYRLDNWERVSLGDHWADLVHIELPGGLL
ncbi:hypothetical protein ABT354_11100 [Streptomyces sp. NPDC000594]|uniref:hypothetical protein n=1 Tax=Streptomyces sp. NPDC000594 TaxID=3154261 RepID=UPI00332C2EEE